jgi:hypothetical protein
MGLCYEIESAKFYSLVQGCFGESLFLLEWILKEDLLAGGPRDFKFFGQLDSPVYNNCSTVDSEK